VTRRQDAKGLLRKRLKHGRTVAQRSCNGTTRIPEDLLIRRHRGLNYDGGVIPTCSRGSRAPANSVRTSLSRGTGPVSAETRPSKKILLEGILLKADGSLYPNSAAILDSAVEILQTQPNAKFHVETCGGTTGANRPNLRLSQWRADAVTAYLEEHGIPSSRLIPRGCGATRIVATNNTNNTTDAQNRRVELVQID
jgi:hypothetical protein